MSIYYSNKSGITSIAYSTGSNKQPIQSIYYSNGSTKNLVWNNGPSPTSNNDYVITLDTTIRSDNGQIYSINPTLASAPVDAFMPGDWEGFLDRDYWGNMYGSWYDMGGDPRGSYFQAIIWNPQTKSFVQSYLNRFSKPYYIDPITQICYRIHTGNKNYNFGVMMNIPSTLDPSVQRTYTADTEWRYISSSNKIGTGYQFNAAFGGNDLNNREIFMTINPTNYPRYMYFWKFYPSLSDVQRVSTIQIPSPYITNESDVPYVQALSTSGAFSDGDYLVAMNLYNDSASGADRYAMWIMFYNNDGTTSVTTPLPGYRILKQIGPSNNFSAIYFYVLNENDRTLEILTINNKGPIYDFVKSANNSIATSNIVLIPQMSTESKLVEYKSVTSNSTGTSPNYYMDIELYKYQNRVQQNNAKFTNLRFSANSPTINCNTPYYNYFKDYPLKL